MSIFHSDWKQFILFLWSSSMFFPWPQEIKYQVWDPSLILAHFWDPIHPPLLCQCPHPAPTGHSGKGYFWILDYKHLEQQNPKCGSVAHQWVKSQFLVGCEADKAHLAICIRGLTTCYFMGEQFCLITIIAMEAWAASKVKVKNAFFFF